MAAPKRPAQRVAPPVIDMPPDHQFPASWAPVVPTDPRQRRELYLFQKWKEQGEDPVHGQALLDSLEPLVSRRVNEFTRGVPIPRPTIRAQAQTLALASIRKYDPENPHGAQLQTWVTSNIRGIRRFVAKHQNAARITEDRALLIGDEDRARGHLREELGREPTAHEVADRMNESADRTKLVRERDVTRLKAEKRRDNIASASLQDPFSEETPREREVLMMVYFELPPEEKLVFERLTGYGGHPKLGTKGAIAADLHWSPSKVSTVIASIAKRIEEFR